jgi:predicted transcriptional regulator
VLAAGQIAKFGPIGDRPVARTVTLPGAELAELGVTRPQKYKTLARLEAAGIIRIEKGGAGRTVKVTLLWQAG